MVTPQVQTRTKSMPKLWRGRCSAVRGCEPNTLLIMTNMYVERPPEERGVPGRVVAARAAELVLRRRRPRLRAPPPQVLSVSGGMLSVLSTTQSSEHRTTCSVGTSLTQSKASTLSSGTSMIRHGRNRGGAFGSCPRESSAVKKQTTGFMRQRTGAFMCTVLCFMLLGLSNRSPRNGESSQRSSSQ